MNKHIKVEIVEHSFNQEHEIITFSLRYPYFIHQELLTHRMLSRTYVHSRIADVSDKMSSILHQPFIPEIEKENKKMIYGGEMSGMKKRMAELVWRFGGLTTVINAKILRALGVHRSLINRILEPYSTIETIVTATDWSNFFNTRLAKDTEPHFRYMAQLMDFEIKNSRSSKVDGNHNSKIHAPFSYIPSMNMVEEIREECKINSHSNAIEKCRIITSVVSVMYPERRNVYLELSESEMDEHFKTDYLLYNSLIEKQYWCPFEHAAVPNSEEYLDKYFGNLRGWMCARFLETGIDKSKG